MTHLSAWRRADAGLIEGAFKNEVGRWVVEVEDPEPPKRTVLYARVSSHDQKGDLDMIELMTCFSARLYGKRSAKNRARRAMEALRP